MECSAQNRREWGVKHPDRVREGFKRWVAKNEDRYRTNSKLWRLSNLDKKRVANAKWQEENREKARESVRRHYRNNLDLMRIKRRAKRLKHIEREKAYSIAWAKANPEKRVAREAKRRAQKRGSTGTFTDVDISSIFKAQRGKCGYCRLKLRKKYHVDHIKALARGGSNDRTNLQILCVQCNLSKSSKDPIDFAQSLGLLL